MVHAYGSTLQKILKKSLIKPPPRDRFQDVMERDFFNGVFKKNFVIFHECPTRKGAFSVITG
jgi:hypothetical protein